MRYITLTALCGLVLILSGCNSAYKAQQAAWQEGRQIMAECKADFVTGEIKSYVGMVNCGDQEFLRLMEESGFAHMDLLRQYTTSRQAIAERVDRGKITKTEADARFATAYAELNTAIQERNAYRRMQYSYPHYGFGFGYGIGRRHSHFGAGHYRHW